MSRIQTSRKTHLSVLTAFSISAGISLSALANVTTIVIGNDQNALFEVADNVQSLLSGNRGSNGGGDQSLQAGDVLSGTEQNDIVIGALGIDVLFGDDGNDVLFVGTEEFNPFNRDRALGGNGNDMFIWAPGDGSDFFDGGPGIDIVTFGLLGEEQDSEGNTAGAPFFGVSPPGTVGSQNFDGIYLDPATSLPAVSVSGSPGFCTVLDRSTHPVELEILELDQLVRFSLRGIADAFDAGSRTDDDGLRVALSLRNVEYLVCTRRQVTENGGQANIEVLDISTYPPSLAALSDLPEFIQQQIQ